MFQFGFLHIQPARLVWSYVKFPFVDVQFSFPLFPFQVFPAFLRSNCIPGNFYAQVALSPSLRTIRRGGIFKHFFAGARTLGHRGEHSSKLSISSEHFKSCTLQEGRMAKVGVGPVRPTGANSGYSGKVCRSGSGRRWRLACVARRGLWDVPG